MVSSSPERLVSVRGDVVETRPIAGTRPRFAGDDDAARIRELVGHPKERAEHVMLIDLERNDLGRVCTPGSVEVDELMTVESYAHVHHIVSNVRGRLRAGATPGEVIRAVFPGGTITGCPKVRCMQIIAELEGAGPRRLHRRDRLAQPRRRPGPQHPDPQRASWRATTLRFRTGAGIVADSDAAARTRRNPRQGARHAARAGSAADERAASFVGDARVDAHCPATIAASPMAMACSKPCACIAAACRGGTRTGAPGSAAPQRLRLALPDRRRSGRRRDRQLLADGGDGVLKLIVTPRRWRPRLCAATPTPPPVWRARRAIRCRRRRATAACACAGARPRLALQPALAGIKHCNRLEQVLARAEWHDAGAIDEGLMRSTEGDVVCATAANLFVLHGGRWLTPRVDRCGVAGVCRAWVLAQTGAAEVRMAWPRSKPPTRFSCAMRCAVSCRWPGSASARWPPHPAVAHSRSASPRAHPGFAAGPLP